MRTRDISLIDIAVRLFSIVLLNCFVVQGHEHALQSLAYFKATGYRESLFDY